ncbi:MAG: DUF481 domain-containing protein [Gammaproteobacteria bacterium]|nr:DUF481 domain-containing protein [Gammaproteobacteria bacterium]
MKANTYFVAALLPCIANAGDFTAESEIGSTFTFGNTESQSVNFALDTRYRVGQMQFSLNPSWIRTKTAGEIVSERIDIASQARYEFSKYNYTFVEPNWQRDRPNGLESQTSVVVGMGRYLGSSDSLTWEGELGYGLQTETNVGADAVEDSIGYLALKGKSQLSDNIRLDFKVGSKLAEENVETKAKFSASVELGESMWLRVANTLKHNTNKVGFGGEKYDSTLSLSLVQSW